MTPIRVVVTAMVLLIATPATSRAQDGPVAWLSFDRISEGSTNDEVTGIADRIEGNFRVVAGVAGNAVRFDGFTTEMVRTAAETPPLEGSFAIEAWVALGAYPWNWCPVVSRNRETEAGYCLKVGPLGELKFGLAAGGEWHECVSEAFSLPLRTWMHIAGTYDETGGMALYINGEEVAVDPAAGTALFAEDVDLRIGTIEEPLKPSDIHREHGTVPGWYCFDGILDEVRIHNRARSGVEILRYYDSIKPGEAPDLPVRRMPTGPEGPGRFGAYYCELEYYDEWDALWPVASDPDVVVRFDDSAARVVFWRGTRYSAAWISENGLWMGDQSVEAWKVENDEEGCFEHMQDRHCRYSHVRIIESNDARVVVHWRYAPVSSRDNLWRVDEKTGWACWVDEYYYIYPDLTGIRNVSWQNGTLGRPRQFQESLPFTDPGQLQGNVVNADWCTIGNLRGETAILRFVENPAEEKEGLPGDLTWQIYNFKSKTKPFIVFEPGNRMQYLRDRNISALSRPGACNHWPVGQAYCDGRTARAADRPTHFLGFPISYPPVHEQGDRRWWNGLYGMTELSPEEFVLVARSWSQAPELKLEGAGFRSEGYDRGERAYLLSREDSAPGGSGDASADPLLEFELEASEDSPLFNPAFVICDWGDAKPEVWIDNTRIERGEKARVGRRYTLEGTDLIVWLELESKEPVSITVKPSDVPADHREYR